MKIYKCIIWDWNGTLLNDLEICINVMNGVLNKRKLPLLNIEKYTEIFGFPVKCYYEKLGFDFEKEPFEQISTEYVIAYQKESLSAKLSDNCVSTLEHFRNEGVTQIILSASKIEHLEEQVRYFGISDFFDALLGLDNVHASSKVGIGKEWLSESGFNKRDVLLIGDTIHDYETACEIGCDCILVAHGHQNRERLAGLGVSIVESLKEVEYYLDSGR
jgi:phosphoglycolate phosphatase